MIEFMAATMEGAYEGVAAREVEGKAPFGEVRICRIGGGDAGIDIEEATPAAFGFKGIHKL